ncbi:unnamed protein product [Rotaria sordida]|uniref:Uncharacterized protein n=1 Tax=Rotaria sordida TaxID=392033 RepID=A0A819XFK7_9BILA|nr:unnamed protein product [Rotaria sordida]CAF1225473.1 unnamed protein product [Rotaria sordida]CAF3872157.1 unnamed protein product [Rotaria sordida]CAF4138738.1 unnamed protein product [Rotaria sordida]
MERGCSFHLTAASYCMLGKLRIKAKRFDETRNAFERCIQACINSVTNQTTELHGAYLDLIKCLIQLKRFPQAIERLTTFIKPRQPNQNAEAYLQRGIAKIRIFTKYTAHELIKLS